MTPRRLIRDAVKAALLGQTRAGVRVFSGRPNPLNATTTAVEGGESASELPAIIIYSRSTKSQVFDESPRRYRHEAEITIECALEIQAGQEIDDELDAFEQEVLERVLADDTLSGTADDLVQTGSTNAINGDGAKLLGAVIITLEASYYTNAPLPGTAALDDLQTVHTEHSLGAMQADPADRAKTTITGLDA